MKRLHVHVHDAQRFYVKVEKGSGTQGDPIVTRYYYAKIDRLTHVKYGYTTRRMAEQAMSKGVGLYGTKDLTWSIEEESF